MRRGFEDRADAARGRHPCPSGCRGFEIRNGFRCVRVADRGEEFFQRELERVAAEFDFADRGSGELRRRSGTWRRRAFSVTTSPPSSMKRVDQELDRFVGAIGQREFIAYGNAEERRRVRGGRRRIPDRARGAAAVSFSRRSSITLWRAGRRCSSLKSRPARLRARRWVVASKGAIATHGFPRHSESGITADLHGAGVHFEAFRARWPVVDRRELA